MESWVLYFTTLIKRSPPNSSLHPPLLLFQAPFRALNDFENLFKIRNGGRLRALEVMGADSNSSDDYNNSVGWNRAGGLIMKTLVLVGGALFLKRLTKSTTRWDHARSVSQSLSGEKVSVLCLLANPQFLCSEFLPFLFFFFVSFRRSKRLGILKITSTSGT